MSLATANLKWSATRNQSQISDLQSCLAERRERTLTAIPARLDAVVDVGFVLPLHTPQYQARQITVKIFLQLSHLRSMSRLGAANHDCFLGGRLASDCTAGRSGAKALDSCRGVARIGQFDLQGFVLILCFGEGVGQLISESLRFG